MINLYKKNTVEHLPPISEEELSDSDVLVEINDLKNHLRDSVLILGHHYQQDDIISFADITGDSLKLAQEAQRVDKEFIIFCGVHFMAETADILTQDYQKVILPDLQAGCTMADMADSEQIASVWDHLKSVTSDKIIPVTYINCSAELKSFVGENGGSICTSSNAREVITWALDQGNKLLFFPDQHLGRNTCFDLGIPLEQTAVYNPNMYRGGLTSQQISQAKVLLWYGFCSVHQGFTKEHVTHLKKKNPKIKVLVHPECSFDVVQAADESGSTAAIIRRVKEMPDGSEIAIGTEINLVNRLAKMFSKKKIISLSPYQCLCTTMYRVRPRWLLASLRAIANNRPINVIKVSKPIQQGALKALDTMLNLS